MAIRRRDGRLSDDELAGIIRSELEQADGTNSDELDTVRAHALERYYGKPRGDEVQGRSKVQSLDVQDTVEAIVNDIGPSLSRPGGASFVPLSEADEQQADIETAACDKAIYQDNDGFRVLIGAVKDALLMRTAFGKVAIEVDETAHTETLHGLTGEAVGMAAQPMDATETVELLSQDKTGENVQGEDAFTVKLRRIFRTEKLVVKAVPAERMRYASDWNSTTIEGNRFVAEFERLERGELIEMGISKSVVDALPASPVEDSRTAVARWTSRVMQAGGNEPSTELVDCYHAYLRVDVDGDGVPELWRTLYASNRVIDKEQVAFVPYVSGTATIRPFRVDGISTYDRQREIENTKTGALRQWMDNLSYMNNQVVGISRENHQFLGDWTRRKPGSFVRLNNTAGFVPLGPTHDLGTSSLSLLDYVDKMRSERGGASLDLQTAEAQIAGHTAGGTERQYSAREKATRMQALTFAETFLRDMYRLVHRTMRTQMKSVLDLKRAGEWQRTDPRQWKERSALTCNIGRTQAENARRQAALTQVISFQGKLLQEGEGGVLTDKAKAYNALVDWCEASGLEAPEQYWTDPTSQQAQQAAKAKQDQAQQAKQAEDQANAALLRLTLSFERWKEEQETQRHAQDIRLKYVEAALDSEAREAEIIGKATADLEQAQLRARNGNRGETQ